MRIFFIIKRAFITTSAALCRAVIAFAASVMTIGSVSGSAKTAGTPLGASKASLGSTTASAGLTLRCGCFKSSENEKRVADFVFREENNRKLVQVPYGSMIKIELKENPTTGYKWTRPVFDETILALERDEFLPADRAGIGAGGIRQFVLYAKGVGQAVVRLVNRRPWESDDQAVAHFELSIEILK